MMVHTFNPCRETEQLDLCELETILIYIMNSRLHNETLSQIEKEKQFSLCPHHPFMHICALLFMLLNLSLGQ